MTVFVEFVILDNMIIDSLLLIFTSLTLRKPVNLIRITASSAVGTLVTIIFSFLKMANPYALMLKLSLGMLMCLIASKFRNAREFFTHFSVFTAYTFISGGAIMALLYLLCADVVNALTFNYTYGIPVGIIFGGITLCIFLAIKLTKTVYRKKSTVNCDFKQVILTLDKEYHLTALVDSGNLVTFNDNPVFFAVGKQFKNVVIGQYCRNILEEPTLNARISFVTVTGETNSPAILVKNVIVGATSVNCYIAIGNVDSNEYDIIIGKI